MPSKKPAKPAPRPRRRPSRAATPPAAIARVALKDDPGLRYKSSMEDRHSGIPRDTNLAALRAAALVVARKLAPAAGVPAMPAVPGANNWVPIGPLAIINGQANSSTVDGGHRIIVSGRLTGVAPDPTNPSTLYLASARGGIWKTLDGGVTWQPKSDHEISLAIGALALAPSDPRVLYAGTGEGNIYYFARQYSLDSVNASYNGSGILYSSDAGEHWQAQGVDLFTGAAFFRIAIHPKDPRFALAASSRGLHRTTDGGANWVAITSGGLPPIGDTVIAATDAAFDPADPTVAYVAFWGNGIYKTSAVGAPAPAWTKLLGGLPTTGMGRIALALAPTAPQNCYAFIADDGIGLNGFFASADGGGSWQRVAIPGVQAMGCYMLDLCVDVSTPDVVYLAGESLYKASRTAGAWQVVDVGADIHPDHHAIATHPTDHQVIFAGTDGGLFRSRDGGGTWDDSVNEGLAITQFEFIDQHPTSDAFLMGGTQDNGTQQFRNSPAFYHSADGDGGATMVDPSDPRNVIRGYIQTILERSTAAGRFASYDPISRGLAPDESLFYPPLAYDPTAPQNVALGTVFVRLDPAQGTAGWPGRVELPGLAGRVSALSYVSSTLIYAGSSSGEVYRLDKGDAGWSARALHANPLPQLWIWGIAPLPGTTDTLIVVMSGFSFGPGHVWRGAVAADGGSAAWTDISGTSPQRLRDVPVNALCIDPLNRDVLYIGTDVGVSRTVDGGQTWSQFSDGLPNTAVYDLLLHGPTRLLRAATHGRGLWERKLDGHAVPDVEIYLRRHLMDRGRVLPLPAPVAAAFDDPTQQVGLGDPLWWWMCADIKVDTPAPPAHTYQAPVSNVDYRVFEIQLAHRDPRPGTANRVYVQVHARGIRPATGVAVKVLFAVSSPALPDLPPDFWTAFPGDGSTSAWTPIGPAKTLPAIAPLRPEVVEWDWVPPPAAGRLFALLVVTDSAADPIPPANRVFDVATLVQTDRHLGLKSVCLVDGAAPEWFELHLPAAAEGETLRLSAAPEGWSIGLLLPAAARPTLRLDGFAPGPLTPAQTAAAEAVLGDRAPLWQPLQQAQTLAAGAGTGTVGNLPAASGLDLLLSFTRQGKAQGGAVSVIHTAAGKVAGGMTFLLASPN